MYHDFQIQHNRFTDNSKIERGHWTASTGLNAYYEFNNYAQAEGIGTAHGADRLRVWLLNNEGGAAAPMLWDIDRHLSNFDPLQVVGPIMASIILGPLGFNSWNTAANVPDVIYNYGRTTLRSDAMKSTYYHEYAHVSHYRGLPAADRYSYWQDNINRIVSNVYNNDNPPYGSANTTGAGRTAIMEAWGEHVGLFFADKRYGVECELSIRAAAIGPSFAEAARYVYRLERFDPNNGSADSWIPEGVFWDLLDNSIHNQAPLSVNDPVIDKVQGVTYSAMFRAITQNAPTEIVTVKDFIKSVYPSNSNQIDSLFLEYSY